MASIFPILPNGKSKIVLDFSTKINALHANTGEQRRALRLKPKISLQYNYTLDIGRNEPFLEGAIKYLDLIRYYDIFYVSYDCEELTGSLESSVFTTNHSIADFWFLQNVFTHLFFLTNDNYSVHSIISIVGQDINLSSAPTFSYEVVYPSRLFFVEKISKRKITDTVKSLSIDFREADYE